MIVDIKKNIKTVLKVIQKEEIEVLASSLLPSLQELSKMANLNKNELRIFHLIDDDKTRGLAIFVIEERRINGINVKTFSILGHTFFDYNFFFCDDELLDYFLEEIKLNAILNNIDAIVMENVIQVANTLKTYSNNENTFIYNENKDRNFEQLLKKKSLKRHYNRMNREFIYSCTNILSEFSDDDISELSTLHKERWFFDDERSGFCDDNREQVYAAFKTNKIYTAIYNEKEIVACHYGMLLGKTLLWHTPVINIKYLDYSPLEVLLFETIKYCQKHHIKVLDLGLGDEFYKNRFSNNSRNIYDIVIPVSNKGFLLHLIRKYINTNKVKEYLNNLIQDMKSLINKTRNFTNRINYYVSEKTDVPVKASDHINKLFIITKFSELVELFRKNEMEIKRYHYNRFKANCYFLCLLNESSKILSYGWKGEEKDFYISEIDKTIDNSGKIMLFDFVTPQKFRNRGYYTELLKQVKTYFSDQSIAIFAEENNIASNKVIQKLGFQRSDYSVIKRKDKK